MNDNQQFELLDILTIVSFAMQLMNQQFFSKQVTSNDIMSELQEQDNKYLKVIIEQNERIINLLETFLGHSSQNT